MTELRGFRKLLFLTVESLLASDLQFARVFEYYPTPQAQATQLPTQTDEEQSVYSKISIQAQISRSSNLSPQKAPKAQVQHTAQASSPQFQKNYLKTTLMNKLSQEVQRTYFQHFNKSLIPSKFTNEQQFGLFVAGLLTLQAFQQALFSQQTQTQHSNSQFSLQRFLCPLQKRSLAKAVLAVASQAENLNFLSEFNLVADDVPRLQSWLFSAFGSSNAQQVGQQAGQQASEKQTPTEDSFLIDMSDELIFYDVQDSGETQIEIIARQIGIEQTQAVNRADILSGSYENPFAKKKQQGRKMK